MKINGETLGKSADLLDLIDLVRGMGKNQEVLSSDSRGCLRELKQFLIGDYTIL